MGALDNISLGDLSPVVRRTVLVPQPAAQTDWIAVVPGDQVWRVIAVRFTLASDGNVLNRAVGLQVSDGVQIVEHFGPAFNQVALQTIVYSFVAGLAQANATVDDRSSQPLPSFLVLHPGSSIGSYTHLRTGTDQFSGITLFIEQQQTGVTELGVARQAAAELYDEPV